MTHDASLAYGVHSEAGKLRRVLVHKPGAAMARLTPANCAELPFDDVIWVKQARIEHMTFVDAMRNRGVEVVFCASSWPRHWLTWKPAVGC